MESEECSVGLSARHLQCSKHNKHEHSEAVVSTTAMRVDMKYSMLRCVCTTHLDVSSTMLLICSTSKISGTAAHHEKVNLGECFGMESCMCTALQANV